MPRNPNIPLPRPERELFENLQRNPFFNGTELNATFDTSGIRDFAVGNVRGVVVLESPFPVSAHVTRTTSEKTTIMVQPVWEFLARTDITVTTTEFDFDVTLDNRIDSNYRIEGYWASDAVASGLYLRVNETNSSGLSNEGTSFIRSGQADVTGTGLGLANKAAATAGESYFWADLSFIDGQQKLVVSRGINTTGTTTSTNMVTLLGSKWEDTTTVVTKLGINRASTINMLAGSNFTLYRKPELSNTDITLWVY